MSWTDSFLRTLLRLSTFSEYNETNILSDLKRILQLFWKIRVYKKQAPLIHNRFVYLFVVALFLLLLTLSWFSIKTCRLQKRSFMGGILMGLIKDESFWYRRCWTVRCGEILIRSYSSSLLAKYFRECRLLLHSSFPLLNPSPLSPYSLLLLCSLCWLICGTSMQSRDWNCEFSEEH